MTALLGLCACQPSLQSTLPSGPAAYGTIAPPEAIDWDPAFYRIQVGDELAIQVFQEPDLSVASLIVDPSGNVILPLLGQMRAAGHSPQELQIMIERGYAERYLRDPDVAVNLLEVQPQTVSVEGEVEDPGVYQIRPGQTLLTALALAGSPTDTARFDEIIVFRQIAGERHGAIFDLTEIRAGRLDDPRLLPDDVIVVGYSSARGLYKDFIQTAPLIGVFTRF